MQAQKLKLNSDQVKRWQSCQALMVQARLAVEIASIIQERGGVAYLVGGCVRDFLLDRTPKDFDLVTNWSVQKVEDYFSVIPGFTVVSIGKAFGIQILVKDGVSVDVAQFRKDGAYVDGRHPQSVELLEWRNDETEMSEESLVNREREILRLDAARRDFTMNALFLNPKSLEIIDHFGGMDDIENKILRAVGDPRLRFEEDHLRVLRAFRFQSQLGLSRELNLTAALPLSLSFVRDVSAERFFREFQLLLMGPQSKPVLLEMQGHGWLAEIWPDLQIQTFSLTKAFADAPSALLVPQSDPMTAWIPLWLAHVYTLKSIEMPASRILENLKAIWKKIRAPKNFQDNWAAIFSWFLDPEKFHRMNVGAIVEEARQPASLLGLRLWASVNGEAAKALQKWTQVEDLLEHWESGWPVPFIKGDDLVGRFAPQRIGILLSELYQAQLERTLLSREDALRKVAELSRA